MILQTIFNIYNDTKGYKSTIFASTNKQYCEMRIKEVIKERGFSVSSLADKLGIKQESLSRAINGNPTVETLEKIAAALEVPTSVLFDKPKTDTASIVCPHCKQTIEIGVK